MANLTPRYVRKNIIRGQAQIWIRAYDETAVLPADTVALGGDWAVAEPTGNPLWKPIGATEGGVTMRFTRETTDITVEEQVNPVDVATNTLDPRIEATLAEDTLETMLTAYGGGELAVNAPTSTLPGTREITISDELEHLTLGMEGVNADGYWRRALWLDVLSVAEVETSYRRAETQRLYACSFRLVSPVSSLKIREMNLPITP